MLGTGPHICAEPADEAGFEGLPCSGLIWKFRAVVERIGVVPVG